MQNNIHTIAAQIQHDLQHSPIEAISHLIAFAEAYAVNDDLKTDIIIDAATYKRVKTEQEKTELIATLSQQTEAVVKDYEENYNTPENIVIRQKQAERDAAFLQKPLPNRVIFECTDLAHQYKNRRFALQGVNIQLREGEITGVVGNNGSGKTTFLRMVIGELKPKSGSLNFPNFEEAWYLRKAKIAYIPQELEKWRGNLRENIAFEASVHGLTGERNKMAVDFIIMRLDLYAHQHKTWDELSGGYKLRFALAKALVWKPRLLVLDEPLANLDIDTQIILLNDLSSFSQSLASPMSVLMTSQHLEEIEIYAKNIIMINNGKVLYNGEKTNIGYDRTENIYELTAATTLHDLEKILSPLPATVLHNGKYFIIATPRSVAPLTVLNQLLSAGIMPDHFCNISQSVKRYFDAYQTVVI